jgi:hypothetical protein
VTTPGLRDRWRAWKSPDARASSKYLTARPLDVDAMSQALVDESPETQRIVMVKTELESLAYAGSSRMSGIAVFVAALTASGTLVTALLVPLLSTSLTAVVAQYGLEGELPEHVEDFVNNMLGTTSQPLLIIVAVLVAVALLALSTSLTRDREGAAATMRFIRYRDALAARQVPKPVRSRGWNSATKLSRLSRLFRRRY